jgi:beta-galactosidase
LDSEGESTPRYEEAARIGRALNAHASVFAQPSWPTVPVAILVNEGNHQFCNSMLQGGEHLGYSTRGWHRLLWETGIPVDFIEASELDEPYISQYKMIIMPFPLSISEGLANKLVHYVERGGNLVSEAGPGRVNEQGVCNRGELSPTLAALFGVRHKSFTMVREPSGGVRWSPPERTWGEYMDATVLTGQPPITGALRANLYIESYECIGNSQPLLLHNKNITGVVHPIGTNGGRAWLIGTYIGHSGTAYRSEANQNFLRPLLTQCGVQLPSFGGLLLRKRVTPAKEAWLYTNPTGAEITVKVDVSGWPKVVDLLDEPLERQSDLVILKVKSLDVRVLILQR